MYPTTIHWQRKGVFSELRLQLYNMVILIQIHLALSVPFCFLKRREKMENNDDRMWKKKYSQPKLSTCLFGFVV